MKEYVIGIVQARLASKRLPGKVLLPLNGKPAIVRIMQRISRCPELNDIILATSREPANDILTELGHEYNWNVYRGSEDDVLSRFVDVIEERKPGIVVRINADNFAVDPLVITHGITALREEKLDISTSFINHSYPFGAGAEVATAACLVRLDHKTRKLALKYREHIFLYAYEHPRVYRIGTPRAPFSMHRPDINISVDTNEDYVRMTCLYERLRGREESFTTVELIEAWDALGLGKHTEKLGVQ